MNEVEGRAFLVKDREYSRRNFLKTAAAAGAALSAVGVGWELTTGSAEAQPTLGFVAFPTYQGLGDAAILQFAYQLEILEGTFYANGVDAGILDDFGTTQIAAIRDHEFAHADAISGILGGDVPDTSGLVFPEGVFDDPGAFLELAATLEPVGIGAYQGSAGAIQDLGILAAAGSILGVECDHRTAIDILRGISGPNYIPFQRSFTFDEAFAAAAPFGVMA